MEYIFETEHLRARRFEDKDAERLYEYHLDEAVKTWIPNESYEDPEEALETVRFFAGCAADRKLPYVLAVELKETGELIGDTGINEVEGRPEEVEIGFVVCPECRNRGYATELAKAMTDFAVSAFRADTLWGRVMKGNDASVRVLEKNGYRFVTEEHGAEDDPRGCGMLVYRKQTEKDTAERFDLYTADRVKTGRTMLRGEPVPDGLCRLVVHVCIFDPEGRMLIQQRQPFKKGWSGLWDLSVGGCAVSGDSSRSAAERETREELGLDIRLENVRPTLTLSFDHGFDDFYVLTQPVDLSSLRLQPEEVQAVRWADREEILRMIDDGQFIPYEKSLIGLLFFRRNHSGAHTRSDPTRPAGAGSR